MNKFVGMGRFTKNPEQRTTSSGISVVSFTLAIDRRYKDASGNRQTDFITHLAYRQTADFIAKHFQKGDMIAVVGSVQTRSWDGNDGQKHYATEVIVDEAYFCGSKQAREEQADDAPPFDV